jgi:hypothetical protein
MPDFKAAIETAKQRAQIRKHNAEELDSLSTASDPGQLKRQKDWLVWSCSLTTYLSTILGQDGFPLSYVIRENDDPDYEDWNSLFKVCGINCDKVTHQQRQQLQQKLADAGLDLMHLERFIGYASTGQKQMNGNQLHSYLSTLLFRQLLVPPMVTPTVRLPSYLVGTYANFGG